MSKQHTAVEVKVDKDYAYMEQIFIDVLNARENAYRVERIAAPAKRKITDPRNINRTIASVPKPPKSQLIAEKLARDMLK